MKKKVSDKKVMALMLLLEFLVILILFAPLIFRLDQSGDLTSRLMDQSTTDNVVTGWFVVPAMMLDGLGGLAMIGVVLLGIIYYLFTTILLAWNMICRHVIKENRILKLAVSIIPPMFFSGYVIYQIITLGISIGSMFVILYAIPVLLLVALMIFQILSHDNTN